MNIHPFYIKQINIWYSLHKWMVNKQSLTKVEQIINDKRRVQSVHN